MEHPYLFLTSVFGIFGHGNVTCLGEALYDHRETLPLYHQFGPYLNVPDDEDHRVPVKYASGGELLLSGAARSADSLAEDPAIYSTPPLRISSSASAITSPPETITPASGILMQMMKELPKVGGIAMQGEDEIASIGMCIGAAMTGAKAMTASSAPGLSLYSENIGLAIMGEVPLVIVDMQRLGPATGGATTVAHARTWAEGEVRSR